jgi:hypothetical protein
MEPQSKMKMLLAFLLLSFSLFGQSDLGNRALKGPLLFAIDEDGKIMAVHLAPAVLEAPGTSGGKPTLRVVIPPAAAVSSGLHCVESLYSGKPILLAQKPVGDVLVFWGALNQWSSDNAFTVEGQSVVLSPDFKVGDPVKICGVW